MVRSVNDEKATFRMMLTNHQYNHSTANLHSLQIPQPNFCFIQNLPHKRLLKQTYNFFRNKNENN